jgi:hypothetical protein
VKNDPRLSRFYNGFYLQGDRSATYAERAADCKLARLACNGAYPEDLREIVGAYHRCVTDTVGRFGGFVAKYIGDGVLIYFGYPEAHEDDAERAARAGLAVIDAVGQLATQEPLNVRIGIASGLVVVGDLIGAGAAQERGVVGETPKLAARLQALAQPGSPVWEASDNLGCAFFDGKFTIHAINRDDTDCSRHNAALIG